MPAWGQATCRLTLARHQHCMAPPCLGYMGRCHGSTCPDPLNAMVSKCSPGRFSTAYDVTYPVMFVQVDQSSAIKPA